jgi:hypothetical protein
MSYAVSIACVIVLLATLGGYHLMFQRNPYIDRKVAGPTTVDSSWSEITPDEPLKPKGDAQEVGLYLEEPYKHELLGPDGVRMPDGSIVLPQVQIVDSDGNILELSFSGARGEQCIIYRIPKGQGKTSYQALRVRADREITLKSIYWTGRIFRNMP